MNLKYKKYWEISMYILHTSGNICHDKLRDELWLNLMVYIRWAGQAMNAFYCWRKINSGGTGWKQCIPTKIGDVMSRSYSSNDAKVRFGCTVKYCSLSGWSCISFGGWYKNDGHLISIYHPAWSSTFIIQQKCDLAGQRVLFPPFII